jgi:hypothetical protein
MRKISGAERDEWSARVLGQLKLKFAEQITGQVDTFPAPEAARHYILEKYRSNPAVGRIYLALYSLRSCISFRLDLLTLPPDLIELLDKMNNNPIQRTLFVEVRGCSAPFPEKMGILITHTGATNNGRIYYFTLFDGPNFPDSVVGRLVRQRHLAEFTLNLATH